MLNYYRKVRACQDEAIDVDRSCGDPDDGANKTGCYLQCIRALVVDWVRKARIARAGRLQVAEVRFLVE